MSAHRFDQLFDKVGETVTIRQRTEGSLDEFNIPEYTWADYGTETAIITSPAVKTFAEIIWTYQGQMETQDRIAYFKAGSVIAENDRVVRASGEKYEVDVVDQPTVFGTSVLKIAILRRITEQ